MIILILAIIRWTEPQQIDAVGLDDTLFISMVNSNQVWVYRYEAGEMVNEICLGNNNCVSIGFSEGENDRKILVASSSTWMKGYADSLYALDSSSLEQVWKVGGLPYVEDPGF